MNNLSYELLYECTHWWIIIGMLMLIIMMLYDVAHKWWILWNYIVESLLSLSLMSSSRWCCTLVLYKLLSPCILISSWGLMPCWMFNHSYHIDLSAYALHVDLRAYALHVDLRADALHVELRAYALTRWLVPHAYCIVKLFSCYCIVVVVELL